MHFSRPNRERSSRDRPHPQEVLDIKNFRSIRGQVHAPLDAKVVLVHGENGAGKTSLLSAIELALTGKVQSLERADPGYEKQLLHRSATEGSVLLKTLAGTSEQSFKAVLNVAGAQSIAALDEQRAKFFRERVFLPQSLSGTAPERSGCRERCSIAPSAVCRQAAGD